ncbi:RNA 2',3'-cyclic phosphodiesterase [Paraburkholderia phenazinium]|jgi:2'-5' RNA ligase|uniref:RNA 2',3'-cyclic phosphodiesterase n=1 Tax=Paraburkholderia phenazinium TaxID=60549 RepID=A0A1G8NET7_9BURK|nr:RNA 2',3'-cyclic phosphodiesterase [Paraburkholderia phenazinium]SDI78683.1 2'-5' RNA ligase [Paraburkholderia phenazinium]
MQATDSEAIDGWQRCFIALAPDVETRDALRAIPVSANARRVPYEQLHLTVTFIGALTVEQGGALAEALAEHSAPLTPTEVTRIEHWPSAAHPRLTVATLAMTDEFVKLDWQVRSLMIEHGLPVDARAFRPHITLARFGRDAGAAEQAAHTPPNLLARFESLILYSSTLARHGARYRALATTSLR